MNNSRRLIHIVDTSSQDTVNRNLWLFPIFFNQVNKFMYSQGKRKKFMATIIKKKYKINLKICFRLAKI